MRSPGSRHQVALFSPAVWLAAASLLIALGSPCAAAPPSDEECLACHATEGFVGAESLAGPGGYEGSAHAVLGCTSCHADATEIPHADDLAPVGLDTCRGCHGDVVDLYEEGSHARARARGISKAPECADCHGNVHRIRPSTDETSPVHWSHLAATCARCHANVELADGLGVVRPVEAYLQSTHARAVREGKRAAECADCHEPHRTLPAQDPKSSIWPLTVPQTCGQCHAEEAEHFERSVHGKALARGVRDAPTCTDCHGEHRILAVTEPDSPVFAANVSEETCGDCHNDARLVDRRGLDPQKVSTFRDSFHGLALRAGELSVANCASCHGVHDILPASDPRSSVNPANLAATCGTCHPGAGERFTVGPVHVSAALSKTRAEYWIRIVYLWLIGIVITAMALHNAADFASKLRRRTRTAGPVADVAVVRMPRLLRWQHGLVMLSFPVLVYSGFSLTYPESWWAAPLLHWETQHGMRGVTHRAASIVMLLSVLWHLAALARSARLRARLRGLLWSWGDVRHFLTMVAHYVGLRRARPVAGACSYVEKAEYWAFLWGIAVMAATGLPLWFTNLTLRYLPKWVTDVATALHFYEAVLATLAIVVWHLYWVMFDPDVYPMDRSWWNGHPPPQRVAEREEEAAGEEPSDPPSEA